MPFEELAAGIRRAIDDRLVDVWTGCPGRVESYDAASQTVDVQPMIRRAIQRADSPEGTPEYEQLPVLRNVKVLFFRAGPWAVVSELSPGDFVDLKFHTLDPAGFFRTGDVSNPDDRALHHLSFAVATPGLYPNEQALAGDHSGRMVIGKDNDKPRIELKSDGSAVVISDDIRLGSEGASDFAAASSKVDDRLDQLRVVMNTHFHPANGSPASGPAGVIPMVGGVLPSGLPFETTGAEKVKLE
jgi:hypothetical protein